MAWGVACWGTGDGRCPEPAPSALLQTSTSVGATPAVCAATSARTRRAPTSAAAPWASGSLPTAGRAKVRRCGQGGALRGPCSWGEPPLHLQAPGTDSSLVPQHVLGDALVGEPSVKGGLSEMTAHPVPPRPWSTWWHLSRATHVGVNELKKLCGTRLRVWDLEASDPPCVHVTVGSG